MEIKVEELITGQVNVSFSTTVLVKNWNASVALIQELKSAVSSYEVERT